MDRTPLALSLARLLRSADLVISFQFGSLNVDLSHDFVSNIYPPFPLNVVYFTHSPQRRQSYPMTITLANVNMVLH